MSPRIVISVSFPFRFAFAGTSFLLCSLPRLALAFALVVDTRLVTVSSFRFSFRVSFTFYFAFAFSWSLASGLSFCSFLAPRILSWGGR